MESFPTISQATLIVHKFKTKMQSDNHSSNKLNEKDRETDREKDREKKVRKTEKQMLLDRKREIEREKGTET